MRNGKRTQSKTDAPSGMEVQSWYPVIKQEGDRVSLARSFLHPSYYLYMCDKVVAPNVSLLPYLSLQRSQRQRQVSLCHEHQRSLTVVVNIKKQCLTQMSHLRNRRKWI